MPTTFDVKTQGVDHLIDRLKGFEPEVYKVMVREIKVATDKVGATARGLLPAQAIESESGAGWGPWEQGRLDYDGSTVASSIKSSYRSRRIGGQRYVMGLVNTKSAPGAVYALAGSKTANQFSGALPATSLWPRALGPAWHLKVDEARTDIETAIDKAAEAVTRG